MAAEGVAGIAQPRPGLGNVAEDFNGTLEHPDDLDQTVGFVAVQSLLAAR
jgi:hypothetical protein